MVILSCNTLSPSLIGKPIEKILPALVSLEDEETNQVWRDWSNYSKDAEVMTLA